VVHDFVRRLEFLVGEKTTLFHVGSTQARARVVPGPALESPTLEIYMPAYDGQDCTAWRKGSLCLSTGFGRNRLPGSWSRARSWPGTLRADRGFRASDDDPSGATHLTPLHRERDVDSRSRQR
jgi:hypothetical protein